LEKFSLPHAIDEVIHIVEKLEETGESFHIGREEASRKSVRKTYAVFRDSLKRIEKRAMTENISRDSLLDFLVLSIEPRLTHEESLLHRKYLQLYKKFIRPLWKEMDNVQKIFIRELDTHDPLLEIFQDQVRKFNRMLAFIKKMLPEDIE
jgi:predicted AAA+ superfamily ATPase